MNAFDLNISNYSWAELEGLVELPPQYTAETLHQKVSTLQNKVQRNASVSQQQKSRICSFLAQVEDKLSTQLTHIKRTAQESVQSQPTTLMDTYNQVYHIDKSLQMSDTINANGNYIIRPPSTPYAQSFPSEFYPGVLNPLAKRTLRQNVSIDTRFRDNYYQTSPSNFQVQLPFKLSNVVSMQLSAIECQTTFYTISKSNGNNYFGVKLAPMEGETETEIKVVNIPDGNYKYSALIAYINDFLAAYLGGLYANIMFEVDMNNGGSGRTLVGSREGNLPFSLHFAISESGTEDTVTPLPLKFGWILGFRSGTYTDAYQYVSEGLMDMSGPHYMYLVVDDYNNNVSDGFYGAFANSMLNNNILARISLQSPPMNVFTQNNLSLITTPRQYFGPVDIQKLKIQLLDEYGRVINLNNMDWSFCLTFQTIYSL